VVHELCHLKQLNHSKAFWDLVAETVPNHRLLRKKLKGID
jgi:predicted metal-dependent hydrolase